MTRRAPMPNDAASAKAEARRRSREADGPSYCQALDAVAREAGHPHWKAMSKAGPRPDPRPEEALGRLVGEDGLDFGSRLSLATIVVETPTPDRPDAREAAAMIVAAIAHDSMKGSNPPFLHASVRSGRASPEAIVRAAEGMHNAAPPVTRDDDLGEAAWDRRQSASTSNWFGAMAAHAASAGRAAMADALSALSRGDHADRIAVMSAISPIRLMLEPERARFELMAAERYAARTGLAPCDHGEDARAALDALLEDAGILFGDPARAWGRELADELADEDMRHWEP